MSAEKVIVTVKEGKVRGFKKKTAYSNAEYYSFLGIPYGQPTSGGARFKDPVKVKPWNNILDATIEKGGCIQYALVKGRIIGSEDCLYNNIYTPKIPSKGDPLKAVIVCIHPGGMYHGSPDPSYYGAPDYIMHHDVVYVCVGYRLHVLGLLNLKLDNCSGNQVLKDIILSLRWIKENIHVFGGDPENVTVMGGSSGSAYIHLLLLSPLAKGLYHKAILMGMYLFNPLLVHPRDFITPAYDVARSIGYTGPRDDKKLLAFYKKLDVLQIISARPEKYFNETTIQVFPTSPFIPNAAPGEKSPLPVSPEELIPSTNRVPILIGFCRREAAMGIALAKSSSNPNHIADNLHKAIAQNCWGWGANLNDEELTQIKEEVENFYLKGKSTRTAPESLLCDILTDAALSDVYDSLINVISADLPSSVYAYNFYYDGKLDGMRARTEKILGTPLKGAFHATDYGYWCYDEVIVGKRMEHLQQKDRNMIDTFTSLLTTFAKTGNPNYEGMKVTWKPTNPEHPSHLIIDETLDARDEVLNGERLDFWLRLKKKFRKDCNDNS